MTRKIITSDRIAPVAGPFSPGLACGGFLFLSGQVGQDPESGRLVPGGLEAEVEQIFRNLSALLDAAGADPSKIVKVTVYLTDMGQFTAMNDLYRRYFAAPFPARTTVAVAALPLGATVEFDIVAQN